VEVVENNEKLKKHVGTQHWWEYCKGTSIISCFDEQMAMFKPSLCALKRC
jgi:hypothetical protein